MQIGRTNLLHIGHTFSADVAVLPGFAASILPGIQSLNFDVM